MSHIAGYDFADAWVWEASAKDPTKRKLVRVAATDEVLSDRVQERHASGDGVGRRSTVVAPLCGGAGAVALRTFRPIVGFEPMGHALDLLDPDQAAPEPFTPGDVLLAERANDDGDAWCKQCLILWDEREAAREFALLARLPVNSWHGRGGSLLSPCVAEAYFGGGRARRRAAWSFLAWLYPALRRAQMKAKTQAKTQAPFFCADRDHTSRDATCSKAENSALAVPR